MKTILIGIILSGFYGCSSIQPALNIDDNTWEIDGMRINHFEKGEGMFFNYTFKYIDGNVPIKT